MDRTLTTVATLPLSKICLLAMVLCPAGAIAAGLIHPIRVWAAGGQWCQIVSPAGHFQVMYGNHCDGSHVGLVRRFY